MEQRITDVTLTPAEKLLASRIQFDEQVLCLVKSMVGRDIEPYAKYTVDTDGYDNIIGADEESNGKGFTVRLADAYDDTWHLGQLYSLREALPAGHRAFLTEDYNYRPGVTILKTTDAYDILRVHQTQCWNLEDKWYGTEALIQLLLEWQKECSMNLIGADSRNVKFILNTLPDDLVAFAEKVDYLCSELDQVYDFIDYGNGTSESRQAGARAVAEKLAAHLRETRRLYLWWD